MHEFGIASEIWQAARRAAGAHGAARVLVVTIELGELNFVEDEQLRFWVTALAERDGSPGIDLRIAHMPPNVRCRRCGDESKVKLAREPGFFIPHSLVCPRCGSSEIEVTGGREIRVVSAEIEPEVGDGY